MVHLSLSLLGPFQATLAGQPVAGFASQRVRALLAYLAVEADRPHPRETLVGLLWPDWPDRSAFANLRQALANLRACIGDRDADPPHLLISRETIQFNGESDHALDVALLAAAVRDPAAALERVVALYRGPFLDGFSLGDSPAFEEWLTLQRERCNRLMLQGLQRLTTHHERRGAFAEAQTYAQRQVDLEPTQEEGQRQLMRALALGGQRSAALAQYQSCRRVLAEELGEEPAGETVALYEAIRQGRFGASSAAPRPGIVAPPAQPVPQVMPIPESDEGPDPARPLFVAREEELVTLDAWLSEALAGQGRVGFIVGEPGSGKTALAREFARRAMDQHPDLVVAWGNGNAYSGVGDPYLPFIEVLAMLTADIEGQRAAGSLSREHGQRLRALYPAAIGALLEGALGLIEFFLPAGALLGRAQALAPVGAPWRTRLEETLQRRGVLNASAPVSQSDLFQQVTRFLQALARQQPLLLVLDDLQWADAGSIALLFHLGRRLAGSRILVMGMYRPEEVARGRGDERHPLQAVMQEFQRAWGELPLDLARAEGRRFVNALVDSEPNRLGVAFREALHRHTGGHALFTVELWRGLQEREDLIRDEGGRWVEGPTLDWERLPPRVEAAVAATIERLPAEWQELLTVASVEGEEFTAEVVARVLGVEEREVLRVLNGALSQQHRLVAAQSYRRMGKHRFSTYRFRHFLFQHYLYQQLNEVQRAPLHEEVGLALETFCGARPIAVGMGRSLLWLMDIDPEPDGLNQLPDMARSGAMFAGQLAQHFRAAGLTEKALIYQWQAAMRVAPLLAYDEGIEHLRRMLQLLSSLPATPQRARDMFFAQLWLANWLAGSQSHIAPEVGQIRERNYALAQQIGEAPYLCYALKYLAFYHRQRAELRLACGLGQQAMALAQGQHPMLSLSMRNDLALTLMLCGDFSDACAQMEEIVAPCLEPQPRLAGRPYGNYVHDLAHAPWALWCLGYPDRALKVSRALRALVYSWESFADIYQVLCDAVCFTHQLRREVRATEEVLQDLLPICRDERSYPVMRPFATLYLGWVQAQSGVLEQGIGELRQGLAGWSDGFVVLRPYWRGYLAEALALAGRVEEGLETLEEALGQAERTGEGFSLAELHRLKGESLLQRGAPDGEAEAEACFQKAIAVARGQEARSWELRATLSLARLWQRQGKREEARAALAAIYGWFTEGFDTPDLQEARVLLEHLSADQANQVTV